MVSYGKEIYMNIKYILGYILLLRKKKNDVIYILQKVWMQILNINLILGIKNFNV